MPRKTDISKGYHSNNPRSHPNGSSPINSFGTHDVADAMKEYTGFNNLTNLIDDISGSSDYSEFVSKANERSSGWYSTVANAIPLVSNVHNAVLGRESALDYLKNNGLSWKDMEGYNDSKLLASASNNLGGLVSQGGTYLQNIGNDLGKLYSGQKQSKVKMNGYHSDYMDSW